MFLGERELLYIVYLDEFGHVGPYISSDHEKHNTHPVFGLGGVAIPSDQVRSFSTYFFKLKAHPQQPQDHSGPIILPLSFILPKGRCFGPLFILHYDLTHLDSHINKLNILIY